MTTQITVDNIKCGGCGNTVTKTIKSVSPNTTVKIDYETGTIHLEGDSLPMDTITSALSAKGYPLQGEGSITTTAKSYVSCMIGRMTKEAE